VAITDLLALAVAAAAASLVRGFGQPPSTELVAIACAYPVLQVAVFAWFRLYALHQMPAVEECRRLFLAMTVGMALIVAVSFWSNGTTPRGWIALAWSIGLGLVAGSRWAWYAWRAHGRRSGTLSLRTLIVGTNEEARRLFRAMTDQRDDGFEPVGFLSVDRHVVEFEGLPVMGTLADVRTAIDTVRADCVFVATSAVRVDDVSWLARALRPQDVEVRFSTNLPELLISRLSLQPVARIPSLSVRPARLTGGQAVLKRTMDVLASSVLLVLSAPVWLLTAALVKLTSPGPVWFRQERIGMQGKPFVMLKFRTMVSGAELRLDEVRHLNDASGPLFKIRRDPRVTKLGRVLRRYSLDELPQLFNVVRGHMSLVGPRPPLRAEVSAYERWHFARLEVRPGMTGLGQITGRSDRSFEDMVRLDVFYIENWSLAYDLYILAKTIPAVMHGRGAY
jgi:exopolysaccharide biosynthesis polyprenyl glycosylphosphotransferase